MKFTNININALSFDKEQPRKNFNEDALDRLKESILDYGIEDPIRIREHPDIENEYIIINGERRIRASLLAGLEEIPCIIEESGNTLEKQLRTFCLQENLTVSELDDAIYNYWEKLNSLPPRGRELLFSTKRPHNKGIEYVARVIGKSPTRVSDALDRHEFKEKNQEFIERMKEKHDPSGDIALLESTLKATRALHEKTDVRKLAVEAILDGRKTDEIKPASVPGIVKQLKDSEIDEDAAKEVLSNIKKTTSKEDVPYIEFIRKFHQDNIIEYYKKEEGDKEKAIEELKNIFINTLFNLDGRKYNINES